MKSILSHLVLVKIIKELISDNSSRRSITDIRCLLDYNLLHTIVDSRERVFKLWNHTSLDYTLFSIFAEEFRSNYRYYAVIIVFITENTFLFKTVHQSDIEVRSKSFCCFSGYGISICVQDISLAVVSKRSHYRNYSLRHRPQNHSPHP